MKKWIIRIGSLLIFVLSLIIINNILDYKSPHGINQAKMFYKQPRNTIEVLGVGSSHVHCGINTGTLWDNYGIAAYDFSGAEQPLWFTYYYLKESYKYQSPKVVILDVFSVARFKEDYHYKWAEESIRGIRFSKNKMDMLEAGIERDKWKDYFPSFLTYHNRYINLNKTDFKNVFGKAYGDNVYKGFTPGFIQSDQQQEFEGWEELEDYSLTDKSREYLQKIITLTKEHGSELYIVVIPYNMDERDNITYNEIKAIAEKESVSFINFNEYLDEMGIDRTMDFNDPSHLNYAGSVKFSDYLGKILMENEEITDNRGVEKYGSWNENLERLLILANEKMVVNNN